MKITTKPLALKSLATGACAALAVLVAAPASAIVFSQTQTGTITFDPAAGNGTTAPGNGGPLVTSINFGGYLGTPGDLAGENLVAVAIEWSADFNGGSGVSIRNNAANAAFVGVSELGNHSIALPNISQLLTVSAANGLGSFVTAGTTQFDPLLASDSTIDSTTTVAPYLTNFAANDIVATITANFAATLFSSQAPASIGYDFFINSAQSVTVTYISEAPPAIPVPSALLLLLVGLGFMSVRRRSAS